MLERESPKLCRFSNTPLLLDVFGVDDERGGGVNLAMSRGSMEGARLPRLLPMEGERLLGVEDTDEDKDEVAGAAELGALFSESREIAESGIGGGLGRGRDEEGSEGDEGGG